MTRNEFIAKDGKKISYLTWADVENPIGVIQVVHGMVEHAGRYDLFAREMNKRGFIVAADDHRAHGVTDESNLGYSEGNIWENTLSDLKQLNEILKKYDPSGMLIGEAPCMKDMIETTDHDFAVVTAVSLIAIFLIIALVEKSFSLPIILIAVIELGIFINLGLPHYLGQSMAFITPICISTIQLGATVDYAILMTTRYKAERLNGEDKR